MNSHVLFGLFLAFHIPYVSLFRWSAQGFKNKDFILLSGIKVVLIA